MSRRLVALFAAAGLLLSGCATISDGLDAINPFASSGPKMAPLQSIKPTADVRTAWSVGIAKAGDYTFTPAVVGDVVYAASAKGTLSRIEDGKTVWKIDVGQALSAGVGASAKLVVVGTAKGDVLAFSADDGKALWKARVSSEVLAAPVVGDDGVAVKSGDNQVFLLDAGDGGRKWAYQRATPPLSVRSAGSPVFADRYLFVGYPGGKLVALALQNGAPVWEGTVASPKGATELDRVADLRTVVPVELDARPQQSIGRQVEVERQLVAFALLDARAFRTVRQEHVLALGVVHLHPVAIGVQNGISESGVPARSTRG